MGKFLFFLTSCKNMSLNHGIVICVYDALNETDIDNHVEMMNANNNNKTYCSKIINKY